MMAASLYPMWRKEAIADARRRLRAAEKAIGKLQNNDSCYARSIAAITEMHRKALAVYENSPESIGEPS